MFTEKELQWLRTGLSCMLDYDMPAKDENEIRALRAKIEAMCLPLDGQAELTE